MGNCIQTTNTSKTPIKESQEYSDINSPTLNIGILKRLRDSSEAAIANYGRNERFKVAKDGEKLFVIAELKTQFHYLKQEVGIATLQNTIQESEITLQQSEDPTPINTLESKCKTLQEQQKKMKQEIVDLNYVIKLKEEVIKELIDKMKISEKLSEDKIAKTSSQLKQMQNNSNQKLKLLDQSMNKQIKQHQSNQQESLIKPDDIQLQSKVVSSQHSKQELQVAQQYSTILTSKDFSITNTYDLSNGWGLQMVLRSSENGSIFSGWFKRLTIIDNSSTKDVKLNKPINCGLIAHQKFYCSQYDSIKIIDTNDDYKVIKSIEVQKPINKMIMMGDYRLLCVENQGCIDVINLQSDEVESKFQISSQQDIKDAAMIDNNCELAFATVRGILFAKLSTKKLLEELDHQLIDHSITSISKINDVTFAVFTFETQSLQIFDRQQNIIVKEITGCGIVSCIQPVISNQRYLLLQNNQSVCLVDTDTYKIEKIADLKYDFQQPCCNSMVQEFDKVRNCLKVLTVGYNMETKHRKIVEITLFK